MNNYKVLYFSKTLNEYGECWAVDFDHYNDYEIIAIGTIDEIEDAIEML